MGKQQRERWPGGYVHLQKDGRKLFFIERQVGGERFNVSTRAHGLKAAMAHLERFEKDPLAYRPEGDEVEVPLFLTASLTEEFRTWQLDHERSRKHANAVHNRMTAWIEDLGHVDLRKATLRDHIKPALDTRGTMRGHRISSLKAFYGWLRKEKHMVLHHQDPTLDLPVPQAKPQKRMKRKAVAFPVVQKAAKKLAPEYRDVLLVTTATGWHSTELARLVRHPAAEIVEGKRGSTLAVLVTPHKGGEKTRTPVNDPEVLAAAKRLRARGTIPKRPNDAVREACRKAGVPEFTFGVMRHSVATWAIEKGATPEQVAEFLGHKSKKTTQNFYIDVAIPTVSVRLPKLR